MEASHSKSEFQPIAARRHPLIAHLRQQLTLRCACDAHDPIIIAVSGGPDSLALLIACAVIQQGPLTAVHVHHHLRPEADDDAAHVNQLCQQLNVPLVIQHVHPAAEKGNLAAVSRQLRYAALQKVAENVGAKLIAVAHHAEDQLETMLMALCRGTGIDGLAAMKWRRRLTDDIWLIRPLLASTKADCQSLCAAAGITWREDASNVDLTRSRARLRNDVLPVLQQLWPGAAQRATYTADLLNTASDLVTAEIHKAFGEPSQRTWDRDALRKLPLPLLAAGIRQRTIDLTGSASDELGQRHLLPIAHAIIDDTRRPRMFQLPPNLQLWVKANQVTLIPQESND